MILLTDCKINNWSPSKLWICRRLRHATGRHFRDLQQALTFVVRHKDLTIFRIFSWLKLFCWFDVRKKDFQRNELCCNSVSNKKPANFKSFLPNANVTLALSLVGGRGSQPFGGGKFRHKLFLGENVVYFSWGKRRY